MAIENIRYFIWNIHDHISRTLSTCALEILILKFSDDYDDANISVQMIMRSAIATKALRDTKFSSMILISIH